MTLRVTKKLIAGCLFSTALLCAPHTLKAEESESPLSVDTSLGFYTDYMFRGFNMFNGNSIQPAAQLNYETDIGKFSLGGWMHLSADDTSSSERFTEIDQIAKWSLSLCDDVTFTLGNIWYMYPSDDTDLPETQEAFGTVAVSTIANPTVSVYHDYNEFNGQYYELTLSETFDEELGTDINLTPYVTFGFASNLETVYADSGLVQTTVGTSTNLAMGPVTVTPALNYTFESDDVLEDNFWFGFSMSKTF